MTAYSLLWDTSWTTTTIAATGIANGGSSTTAAIDNQNKFVTQVSVQATWTGSPTEGATAYILGTLDGTNYQTTTDNPFGVQLAYSTSPATTIIPVYASGVRQFKVAITNSSGVSMTCTVDYLQATIQQI